MRDALCGPSLRKLYSESSPGHPLDFEAPIELTNPITKPSSDVFSQTSSSSTPGPSSLILSTKDSISLASPALIETPPRQFTPYLAAFVGNAFTGRSSFSAIAIGAFVAGKPRLVRSIEGPSNIVVVAADLLTDELQAQKLLGCRMCFDRPCQSSRCHSTITRSLSSFDAVLFWKVVDSMKAALDVADYQSAINWAAQTALHDVIGKTILSDMLQGREKISIELQKIIDKRTEPWGIGVISVEVKDVLIPPALEDAMSMQAQAERERQARVILGDSERQIAEKFVEAANTYGSNPTAFHLRATAGMPVSLLFNASRSLISNAHDVITQKRQLVLRSLQKSEKSISCIDHPQRFEIVVHDGDVQKLPLFHERPHIFQQVTRAAEGNILGHHRSNGDGASRALANAHLVNNIRSGDDTHHGAAPVADNHKIDVSAIEKPGSLRQQSIVLDRNKTFPCHRDYFLH